MKTWEKVQNEVLGLMFSNANGGEKIALSDASAQEYVINMPDAFNYGIRDLCLVKPYVKKYIVKVVSGSEKETQDAEESALGTADKKIKLSNGKQLAIDLYKEDASFSAFGDNGIYFYSKDGKISKISNYFFMGNGEVVLNLFSEGEFLIYYEAVPEGVSDDTQGDELLKYDAELLDAVIYYMASRLYAEDDIQLSTHYLNIYSDKKEEIRQKYRNLPSSGGESFISGRGWF